MFKTVTLRKACEICGGSGRIPKTGRHRHSGVSRRAGFPAEREGHHGLQVIDRAFVSLLVLILAVYVVFQFEEKSPGTGWWIKIAAAMAALTTLMFLSGKPARTPRFPRRSTLLLIFVAVCGGLAFEILKR